MQGVVRTAHGRSMHAARTAGHSRSHSARRRSTTPQVTFCIPCVYPLISLAYTPYIPHIPYIRCIPYIPYVYPLHLYPCVYPLYPLRIPLIFLTYTPYIPNVHPLYPLYSVYSLYPLRIPLIPLIRVHNLLLTDCTAADDAKM